MRDTSRNHGRFVAKASGGKPEFVAQFFQIGTDDITEFDVFEPVPNALIRIEIGRIAGEPFEMNPLGTTIGE